jgi:hypothetical protein
MREIFRYLAFFIALPLGALSPIFGLGAWRHFIVIGLPIFFAGNLFSPSEYRISSALKIYAVIGLTLLFISTAYFSRYSLFPGPTIRGEIILLTILIFFLLKKESIKSIKPTSWACLAALFSFIAFLFITNGRLLFTDDLATFFFRFSLLKENFPFIPFYYPAWNLGLDARDFFATGSLSFFLLFAPIIYAFPLKWSFTPLIGALLFLVLPASIYFTARNFHFTKKSATYASIIAVSTSLFWFRWGIKYGTLGFITSTALFPLSTSLIYRIFFLRESPSPYFIIASIFVTALSLMWSPMALCYLPLGVLALFKWRLWWNRRPSIIFLGSVILITLSWSLLFFKVSKVTTFVNQVALAREERVSNIKSLHRRSTTGLKDLIQTTHPLLLLFGVIALHPKKRRPREYFFLSISGALLFFALLGRSLKPQLELERLLLVLQILLTIPVGQLIAVTLSGRSKSSFPLLAKSIILAHVTLTPAITSNFLSNRTSEQIAYALSQTEELANFIKNNNDNGRTFFSGFVTHEYSGGHLAPLPLFANDSTSSLSVHLMAHSWAHNMWQYSQMIPESYLDKEEKFFELNNVSLVVAHEPKWHKYFMQKKNSYLYLKTIDKFSLFKVINFHSNWFLTGEGEVIATKNSLEVIPLSSNVTLKFRYFPFLQSNGECKISGVPAWSEYEFIHLSGCTPQKRVTIKSVSPWRRLTGVS